jgi:hypothetical protein
MDIPLSRVYPVSSPGLYKLHLACWNGSDQPLDVFVRSKAEWDQWNAWRAKRDDFNRDYVFSLIDFYPEQDRWLFGGVYRVISRKAVNDAASYKVELLAESEPFVGRLKLSLKRPCRSKAVKFENHYNDLLVSEILPTSYSGEAFCGYDEIDVSFSMLESIMKIQRPDWKAALENAKGVYVVTDASNGKRYIGSAYGSTGIWSRWGCYINTGHGYNDELTHIIDKHGIAHARQNFRFALLEHRTPKTDDDLIKQREKYWKDVLLSRGKYGYNRN